LMKTQWNHGSVGSFLFVWRYFETFIWCRFWIL